MYPEFDVRREKARFPSGGRPVRRLSLPPVAIGAVVGDCVGDQPRESRYEKGALLLVEAVPHGHDDLLGRWFEKAQLLHGCTPAIPRAAQYLQLPAAVAKR
jgi:hypothetical protein